jgi:hypothetical protein
VGSVFVLLSVMYSRKKLSVLVISLRKGVNISGSFESWSFPLAHGQGFEERLFF